MASDANRTNIFFPYQQNISFNYFDYYLRTIAREIRPVLQRNKIVREK